MYKKFIGKKVLVRSYDAGVYFGTLVNAEGECVELSNVRNIWRWSGAACLSQIATYGISDDSRVSNIVESMILNRCCQIIPLAEKAIANLESKRVWTV